MNSVITADIASKRRDKLGIIAEILDVAREGTLKTQIMYRANLSFVQLTEYLEYMLKTRLIIKLEVNTKDVYVTTKKGVDFLQKHSELIAFLKNEERKPVNWGNSAKVPPQSLIRKA